MRASGDGEYSGKAKSLKVIFLIRFEIPPSLLQAREKFKLFKIRNLFLTFPVFFTAMDLVISLYAILIPALKLSFFRESYTIKSEWGLVSTPLSYF